MCGKQDPVNLSYILVAVDHAWRTDLTLGKNVEGLVSHNVKLTLF